MIKINKINCVSPETGIKHPGVRVEAPQQPGAGGDAAAGGEPVPGRDAPLCSQRTLRQKRPFVGPRTI